MKHAFKLICSFSLTTICCGQSADKPASLVIQVSQAAVKKPIINEQGTTVQLRFNTPEGFERKAVDENSFASYLRNLPLKPADSKVKYYNGEIKEREVYDAVVDMDIGNKDLQQCADAIMRLRGEYFFAQKEFDKISFTLTNGFRADYAEWMKGKRVTVNGNKTNWVSSSAASNTYKDFRNYMDFIFSYAGTYV